MEPYDQPPTGSGVPHVLPKAPDYDRGSETPDIMPAPVEVVAGGRVVGYEYPHPAARPRRASPAKFAAAASLTPPGGPAMPQPNYPYHPAQYPPADGYSDQPAPGYDPNNPPPGYPANPPYPAQPPQYGQAPQYPPQPYPAQPSQYVPPRQPQPPLQQPQYVPPRPAHQTGRAGPPTAPSRPPAAQAGPPPQLPIKFLVVFNIELAGGRTMPHVVQACDLVASSSAIAIVRQAGSPSELVEIPPGGPTPTIITVRQQGQPDLPLQVVNLDLSYRHNGFRYDVLIPAQASPEEPAYQEEAVDEQIEALDRAFRGEE